jgi:hypothetical protein
MGKLEFDFREGLDKEHIVYKRKGFSWKFCVYYFAYLFFTWGYVVAFFALFIYAYTNNEPVAFPIYLSLWLAFVVAIIIVAIINMLNYKKVKKVKLVTVEVENQKIVNQPYPNEHPTGIQNNIEMVNQRPHEGDTLIQ